MFFESTPEKWDESDESPKKSAFLRSKFQCQFSSFSANLEVVLVQDSAINDDGLGIPEAGPEGQHPVVLLSTTSTVDVEG